MISIEQLRRLLTQPPNDNTARALKEWRAHLGMSQAEAAIRLGVSRRTLQGWELGRPMPYPQLLQRTVGGTRDPYSLVQSEFPREFAEFIDFVGASALDSVVRRVDQKLGSISPASRSLYGDRYFFHEQCVRFTDGPTPFQLDVSDLVAVRAASLIAGINRVKRTLSAEGASRLRAMVVDDNLQPDRDIRQIEHEIRCVTHLSRKGFKVKFADLENIARFDLSVETPSGSLEVECKTVTEDTGSQIKSDLNVDLSETFRKTVTRRLPVDESGLFILIFKRPVADCKQLSIQLSAALQSETPKSFHTNDFSILFHPRPQWQPPETPQEGADLQRHILLDPELGNDARCVTKIGNRIIGLVLRPHKPSTLAKRILGAIKQGAGQCTGRNPSCVWLHFSGFAEAEFLQLAEFSMEGKGAGLNAVVANAVHPSASTTDRSHVERIRFSATGEDLSRHPAIGPGLLISRAVSSNGFIYDVPNPLCRFPRMDGF
jgi:transcriptional regulator with XRE-family HTH domain